jgi:cytidylate kinase
MSFTIAIDGPAAAGKGTLAQALSAHFGFAYLDTGLLYRAVGAGVLAGGEPVAVAQALDPCDLTGDTLRTQAVAEAASQVAVIPQVRAALVAFQRSFARRVGGAVLDGRDIGTVICPDADVKLFVTASPKIRADRRVAELTGKGVVVDHAAILAEVRARDARDQNRAEAPLLAAADAIEIDTTYMTAAEALEQAIGIVTSRRA